MGEYTACQGTIVTLLVWDPSGLFSPPKNALFPYRLNCAVVLSSNRVHVPPCVVLLALSRSHVLPEAPLCRGGKGDFLNQSIHEGCPNGRRVRS